MGSGASRWLTVLLLVRAVSFIVLLVFTEMLLKPNSDGPSGNEKHNSSIIKDKQVLNYCGKSLSSYQMRLTILLAGSSRCGSVWSSGF